MGDGSGAGILEDDEKEVTSRPNAVWWWIESHGRGVAVGGEKSWSTERNLQGVVILWRVGQMKNGR